MNRKNIAAWIAVFVLVLSFAGAAAAAGLNVSQFTFNASTREDVMGAGSSQEKDGKVDGAFSISVSGAQAIKEIVLKNDLTGTEWSSNNTSSFLMVQGSDGSIVNATGRISLLPVILGARYTLYIGDIDSVVTKDTPFTMTIKLVDDTSVTAKTTAKPAPVTTTTTTTTATTTVAAKDEGIADAQSIAVSEFDLAGTGKKIGADGKPDTQVNATFRFNDATVTNMKITAVGGGNSKVWDTLGNDNPLIVVVDSAKNIVSKADGSVAIPVKGSQSYILLIQDNDAIFKEQNLKATLVITLKDGKVFEKQIVKGAVTAAANAMLAEFKGTGKYDFVGTNEKMASNVNPDRQIDISINASGTISGLRIRSEKTKKVWDTIDGNGNPLLAVTNAKGERLNKQDGSVSIPVSGATGFSLWFDEESDNSPYLVTAVLSNGQVIEAATAGTAQQGGGQRGQQQPRQRTEPGATFVTTKPAVVNTDLVGKNKKPAGNGAQDTSLKVEVTGNGKITAMTLADSSSMGWDTLTSNNGRWLLGVREGSKLLNKADGTVDIQVQGSKTLELLMQDNGKLRAATGNFTLSITWNNGKVTTDQLIW